MLLLSLLVKTSEFIIIFDSHFVYTYIIIHIYLFIQQLVTQTEPLNKFLSAFVVKCFANLLTRFDISNIYLI